MAAVEASRQAVDVVVLEEHPIVGDPNHCSGLITTKGLARLGVPYPRSIVDNSVNAVNFYSPSGHKLTVRRSKKGEIHVFQRAELDRVLHQYAVDKCGVDSRSNSRVTQLLQKNGRVAGVRVKPKQGEPYDLHAQYVVDASGANTTFTRAVNLCPPDPHWRLPALQYELDKVDDFPDNFVELYHGRAWAPGFFAWIIPTCGGTARIGLATWKQERSVVKRFLDRFMTRHPVASKVLEGAQIVKKRGGVVTATGPVDRSYAPGYLAVGDVAGQVKATTGGGVNVGGFCGRLAGHAIGRGLQEGRSDWWVGQTYEHWWKGRYYVELKLMEVYRKTIGAVDDTTLDRLFGAAATSPFASKLGDTSDIDLHSIDLLRAGAQSLTPKVVRAMVRTSPQLLYRLGQTIL